jgi:hypothetical protein
MTHKQRNGGIDASYLATSLRLKLHLINHKKRWLKAGRIGNRERIQTL